VLFQNKESCDLSAKTKTRAEDKMKCTRSYGICLAAVEVHGDPIFRKTAEMDRRIEVAHLAFSVSYRDRAKGSPGSTMNANPGSLQRMLLGLLLIR